MKFADFSLESGNNFVAMEYYGLMLNRTFLVLLLEDHLLGLKCNELISVEGGGDPMTRAITRSMSIKSDLDNPYSYLKSEYIEALKPLDIYGDEILQINKANFRQSYASLKSVSYGPKKKCGMGHYLHDGKLLLRTVSNKKIELIVLGSQSGVKIANQILKQ